MTFACPISLQQYPTILMAHGGGGRLMHQLIETMFLSVFGSPDREIHDAAVLAIAGDRIAFTTDSYVVNPLFFPGGDIGSLAVNGTVNDLTMAGARPLYLSLGLILEEGLPMETLWRLVRSIKAAADHAQVQIVTGDTKVVDRGKGDGIFINTSGVGILEHSLKIAPSSIQPGDLILLNGDLGRHGIAVMAAREGLDFQTTIISDSAPLTHLVGALLQAGVKLHCLRDLTRGGLASTLNEIMAATRLTLAIEEAAIPVLEEVQGACELLGLDPLYIANEGRFVAFVAPQDADRALDILRSTQEAEGEAAIASVIGEVVLSSPPAVILNSKLGAARFLDLLSGEQLPRIC
ncbi:hydrogenase [Neosynechococcus sphagnicola sy1]|uniref:Hydrogenase n=1 Tax=Neosynechococcus sphagnicola sy1 TaxID=1497020 RepID=A0A098TJD4_9CYAN|nr:hydrogenase expression/formation protein HypE [Neosynechococcus sphagnicola]KGF72229.1 hydrogenase [Neosynechococcus sphagnicola sy1]